MGIDLGDSYSCVGVVRDDKVEIIPNDLGQKITPSFISFREHPTRKWHLETLIGQAAKDEVKILRLLTTESLSFLFSSSTMIGTLPMFVT